MKIFLLCAVLASLWACSGTGVVPTNDQDIKRYEARRDTEKLAEIASSNNKRERILAIESLGRLRDPRAIPALTESLQSDSWVVRETAVKALGNIKDYMAIKPLIDSLNDEDKFVREAALKGLRRTVASMAKTKDLRFYKPLLGALPNGDNVTREGVYDVLLLGVNTLKRFQDPHLFNPLVVALEADNLYVRESAARLLGDVKDAAVVSPLIEAQQDNSKFVRDAAAESLQRVNDNRAIPVLLKALSSDNSEVRDEATRALSKFRDLDSVNQIIEALKDNDPQVRLGAAKVLGETGSAHAVKPLIPLLKDKNSEVRFAAAGALQQLSWFPESEDEKASNCVASQHWDQCVLLGDPVKPYLVMALNDHQSAVRSRASNALLLMEWQPSNNDEAARFCTAQQDWNRCVELGEVAVPFLAEELRGSDSQRQIASAQALGKIGVPACIPPLSDALQDGSQSVRIAAVNALAQINDPQALGSLVTALDNSNRFVRIEAAQALENQIDNQGDVQSEGLIQVLMASLQDNNRNVRQMGARLLGKIKDPRATIPLIKTLEDSEFEVREEASIALRNIKDPQAIEPLVKALNSTNPEVRAHVIKTLGEFKDHRAIEPLMGTIQDPDPEVRAAAIKVLGTIKDPRAVQPIIKALDDYDEKVRLQAVNVLGTSSSPQVISPLLGKLEDSDAQVREAAGEALMNLKWIPTSDVDKGKYYLIKRDWASCIELGEPAAAPLITELNQADSTIKIPVARTLGEIKEPSAVVPLINYLQSAPTIRDRSEQLEIFEVTTTALTDIGKPSIEYLIPELTNWQIAPYAAQVLKALQWTPRTDEELVRFQVALKETDFIAINWGLVRSVLTRDLYSKDPGVVENALFALIGIGRKEVIDDLITALYDKGNLPIAEAYLNSGQNRLMDAAEIWAMNNGHKVHEFKKGSQPVQWGRL
ncbi:HEAT repeat domain-containing protein [Kaarinaea lacus]